MPKKFDAISPKVISEKKFNQLLDSLPSNDIRENNNETGKAEKDIEQVKQNLIENKTLVEKHERVHPEESENQQPNTIFNSTLSQVLDIFVYECDHLRFGIPVQYVTEITNDFGAISPLNNFIRSCTGTFQYRGRLLPIFDSESCYLRTKGNESEKSFVNNKRKPDVIITLDYNGVMFAMTMQNHIGIVEVEIPQKKDFETESNSSNETDLLLEIVGYEDQNLYIFSPQKMAQLVSRELKNQIVVESVGSEPNISEEADAGVDQETDFMLALIKDSTLAIEITKVLEVIEGFEVTPLYKVSDYIRGLINLRGQVLACIDLAHYLGYDFTVLDERNKFIVVNVEGVEFALCIDDSVGIEALNTSNFQSCEKVFKSEINKYFPEFVEQDGQVKLIFKPELFVKEPDLLQYRLNKKLL